MAYLDGLVTSIFLMSKSHISCHYVIRNFSDAEEILTKALTKTEEHFGNVSSISDPGKEIYIRHYCALVYTFYFDVHSLVNQIYRILSSQSWHCLNLHSSHVSLESDAGKIEFSVSSRG